MSLALESTHGELDRVRAILRDAAAHLMAELGEPRALAVRGKRCTARKAVMAMQFQDLSDQLLASAQRRIGVVREALHQGREFEPRALPARPLAAGEMEIF
jgi:hypothetical protein